MAAPLDARPSSFSSLLQQGPQQREPAPLAGGDARGPAPVAGMAVLPVSVVRRIIGYLPVSRHGDCALVCRHWYASLPDIGRQLAHWQRQCSLLQQQACAGLVTGYSRRIRPWLARQGSGLLPVLECQRQEVQRLEDSQSRQSTPEGQQRLQTAARWFAALVAYSLHRAQIDADNLGLRPLAPETFTTPVIRVAFSACSCRLATAQLQTQGDGPAFLRLYSWTQAGWHQERLAASCREAASGPGPVELFTFAAASSDTLIAVHRDSQLIRWCRQPERALWQQGPLLRTGHDWPVTRLIQHANGDLFLLLREVEGPGCRVLVLHEGPDGQGRRWLVSHGYQKILTMAEAPAFSQMALATPSTRSATAPVALHVWRRDLDRDRPGAWGLRASLLDKGLQPLQLHYAPDGRHLLGLLSGQRACLWALDSDGRVCLILNAACAFSEAPRDMAAQRLFSHSGRQLALPLSLHRIRFWVQQADGDWRRGDTLDRPPAIDEAADYQLRYTLLSADGQTLTQLADEQVEIWHRRPGLPWRSSAWYGIADSQLQSFRACACLLPPFYSFCALAAWRDGRLWIHGENSQGHHLKKAAMVNCVPVESLVSSPDGLSLVLFSRRPSHTAFIQLEPRGRADSGLTVVSPPGLATPAVARTPDWRPRVVCPAVSPGGLASAQTLPLELLHRILASLPVSEHHSYARVCRRWYAALPDSRRRQSWWRTNATAESRQATRGLVAGYSERIRPWLAACKSPDLAVVECQYQETLRQQSAAVVAGQASLRAGEILSALVQEALHRQFQRLDLMRLQACACEADSRFLAMAQWSACSRWLASIRSWPEQGDRANRLQLHAWRQGRWQPEVLGAQPSSATVHMAFSYDRADSLFCLQRGGQLLRWHRHPDTESWQASPLVKLSRGDSQAAGCLIASPRDRLFIFCKIRHTSWSRLSIIQDYGVDRGWCYLAQHAYKGLCCLACAPGGGQLAIACHSPDAPEGAAEIHIWESDLNALVAGGHGFAQSTLEQGQKVLQLVYSPDGRHLLGLLAGQRVCLWAIDGRRRLHQRFEAGCRFSTHVQDMRAQRLFGHRGQCLALARSACRIEFWTENARGDWQPDDQLVLQSPADAGPDDDIRYLLLTADSQTLVRVTWVAVDIWHRDGEGDWQHRFHDRRPSVMEPQPHAQLLPPLHSVCLTLAGRPTRLGLHGPDRSGRFLSTAAITLTGVASGLLCSPDGLSLLVVDGLPGRPTLLQLGALAQPVACERTQD